MIATRCYEIEKHECEELWLRFRLTGCGSSDAAAVVGVNRMRGRYAVWAEKTSEKTLPRELDELIYWGHALENPIFERFLRDAKPEGEPHDPGEYTIYRSTEKPWHFCTPDRLLLTTGGVVPVELKTAHYQQADVWAKEIPWDYFVQVGWQMHVLGADHAYIAVLCNGRDFQFHPIERDEKMQAVIDRTVRHVDKFWHNHVIPRVAPPTDATPATREWLAAIYDEPQKAVCELDDLFIGAGDRFDKLTRLSAKIDKAKTELTNRIKQAMGNCELAILSDSSGFSWSGEKTRRFTRKRKVYLNDE